MKKTAITLFFLLQAACLFSQIPRPEYPRPQFERTDWINLNGEWTYTFDFGASGLERGYAGSKGFDGKIIVPFAPESKLSGVGHTDFIGRIWYQRTIDIPADWSGRNVMLNFGAVYYTSEVYVDGRFVGRHFGGSTSFSYDITAFVKPGGSHSLVVFATSDLRSGKQTAGKQSLQYASHSCDYTRTTGIWQTVWMEAVAPEALARVQMTTDIDQQQLIVAPQFFRESPNTLRVTLRDGGKVVGTRQVRASNSSVVVIPVKKARLWSPEDPFLYDLTVGTTQGDEDGFDTVHSYFALRKWSCEPDAKGILRFCLNGKPILLNGLLDQGYWPQGLYTPPSDAAVERELSEVKALGFNLLRKHAKIEPQRWYYHCDRLGLVVWQDMVNGGSRYNLWFVTYLTNVLQPLVRRLPDAEPLWGLLSRGKASSRETYRKELQATVEALRCHPCIGCWVPFNEGWGQFDAAGAVQAIRTLDDTRLVDEASGWYDQGGGDVCSIHNYFYPLHVKPGKRTVALSEYGGIAWPMPGHEAPGKTYGYGTAKSRADLTARCKKLQLGTVLPQLKKGLSALVYTQLTDVEDEVNGLFTYDRAEIKPDANAVRSVNAALAAEFAKVVNPLSHG